MNILFIGDVVGRPGRRAVRQLVPLLRQRHDLRLVIANAENAAGGSGLIFAHFVEVHPLALEDAMILACQRLAHQPGGPNLNLPDLLENLARDHGTGNSSKIF